MQTLSTALALFGAAVACLMAWRAGILAERASEHEIQLRRQLGRVGALEEALASLSSQHAKLRGKFYSSLAPVDVEHVEVSIRDTGPTCDNWLTAQLQGPRSEAAKCECNFCTGRRAARAAEKSRILAERNRAKANGSE